MIPLVDFRRKDRACKREIDAAVMDVLDETQFSISSPVKKLAEVAFCTKSAAR